MRHFLASGSRMETYSSCGELSMRIEPHHMLLVVFPFCGLQLASPFPTLYSGSDAGVPVGEERSRKTGLDRSMMVDQSEDWIIPFHYERNDCRSIDGICYLVLGVGCGWEFGVLGARCCRKQLRTGRQNERREGFRSR